VPFFCSYIGNLPEDGLVEAETCIMHIVKWQLTVCCSLCSCWINPAQVPWGLCDPSPLWLTFFF